MRLMVADRIGDRLVISIDEALISLPDAAKALPRRRRGRNAHVSTLFRWTTIGVRGVVLESIQIGGTRCTSREALQRFFEQLSLQHQTGAVAGQPGPSTGRRTTAQRQRQSAEAGRKLAELGA
jgi:hypothetical protein